MSIMLLSLNLVKRLVALFDTDLLESLMKKPLFVVFCLTFISLKFNNWPYAAATPILSLGFLI